MKKSTIIAAVLFLALLAAALWSVREKPERGITRVSFTAVDPAAIERVKISGKNPAELKRGAAGWVMADGRKANSGSAKRLVESIPGIESSSLVTSDADRFAELEVDDEKGTRVQAWSKDGKSLADFTVGKSASGGAHIRVGGDVYLVKKVFSYVFSKKASGWYELKLFDAKLDSVKRAEIRPAGGQAFALVEKDGEWNLEDPEVAPEGFRFDKGAARAMVSSLVNARAKEIVLEPVEPEKTGLDKPAHVLVFEDKDGEQHELHLGAKTDKDDVYARVKGRDEDIFLLARYTARNLTRTVADLRDLKMVELDSDKATRLSIKDGKRELVLVKKGADWSIEKSSETIPDDFELDPQAAKRFLGTVGRAKALALSGDTTRAKAGLTRPGARIQVDLEDGKTAVLTFGAQTKHDKQDAVFAQGNIDSGVYLVAKRIRDNLTKGLDSFKKRPVPQGMPNLDPKQLSNLPPEVRSQLMQQFKQQQQKQKLIESLKKRQAAGSK